MTDIQKTIIGLVIPFSGTVLGSAMVFLMRDKINIKIQKALLGFAAGVMIAASIWSLIIPSMSMAVEQGYIEWLPATIGFACGIGFLLLLDYLVPHLHLESNVPEGAKSKAKRTTMMFLAVTLHNIPEGMAVGVIFAGLLTKSDFITASGALTLAIGIALQNFPEGASVAMPFKNEGFSRKKSFLYGSMSGIVEPIAAIITILLTNLVVPILPYLLSFAAGAMIYVVVEELIPEAESGEHSNLTIIGLSLGFMMMMVLDVAFG